MIHNIYIKEEWNKFIKDVFYIGKYKFYDEKEIIILDGSKMQTSSDFIYEIFAIKSSGRNKKIYDYCKCELPNNYKYSRDQLFDYMREIGFLIEDGKVNKLLILIANRKKVLSLEYSQDNVDDLFTGMVFENEIDGQSIDVISFKESLEEVDYKLILDVTKGPWGNPFEMDYYSNKIEDEIIPLCSIVLVNEVKYVVGNYDLETTYYTLYQCLNYKNKIKVQRDKIESVLKH